MSRDLIYEKTTKLIISKFLTHVNDNDQALPTE